MQAIPSDLTDVVTLALEDLDEPGDNVNESAEFILIMRRQTLDGDDEVMPYTSPNLTGTVAAGMLQCAQKQILDGMFQPYEDDGF